MRGHLVASIVIGALLSGCATEPDPLYIDVDMRLGTIAEPRIADDWATGWVVLDENQDALPPGVFTVRVRHYIWTDPDTGESPERRAAVTAVEQTIDPASACTFKSRPVCTDGACLTEIVQPELGLCLLDIRATTTVGETAGCWFLGTFPRDASGNDVASAAEERAIASRDCSGSR